MSTILSVVSVLGVGITISFRAPSAEDKPRPAPLVHFRFNGNAKNEGKDIAPFELKNTEFRDGALYLNGRYEFSRDRNGYRAVFKTPKLNYKAFTVAIRIKAEQFTPGKSTILVGGTSARWFGMNRAESGNLTVTLNNQAFAREIADTQLDAGQWIVVACGVDLRTRRLVVFVNGKKADDFTLPKDFRLNVIGSSMENSDKNWSFANYSNADVFCGLVDELIIHNRLLTDDEFSRIPLVAATTTESH
jgi:hypothetical protein